MTPGAGYSGDSPFTARLSGRPAIRGLIIDGFASDAISLGDESSDSGFTITCNVIGTSAHPNGGAGISLSKVSNSRVGADLGVASPAVADMNVITHNKVGIAVISGGAGDRLDGNVISDNTDIGIDLGGDGATANDPGDTDGGPNDRNNSPIVIRAEGGPSGGLGGTLNSTAGGAQDVTFYYLT